MHTWFCSSLMKSRTLAVSPWSIQAEPIWIQSSRSFCLNLCAGVFRCGHHKKKNHNFSHNKPNSSEFKHTSCITLIDTSVEWLSSFYIYQKIQWLTFTDMVLLLPQAMTLLHNQLILCFTSLFQKTAKTVWLSMAFCPSDDTAYWLHRWFTHPFLHDVLKFWHCLGLHLADPLVMLFTLFSYTRRSDV